MQLTHQSGADTDAALIQILLVDDDEVDRRVIRRCLAGSGLHLNIHETADPEDVLAQDDLSDYHCLLLDYRFPTGSAFELFASLLATPCSRRPPVVLLTGQGDERVAAESIERGAQEYMSKKELGAVSIRRAIESALEKSQIQRKLEKSDEDLARMSYYDMLTGLANRRLFFRRLEETIVEAERNKLAFVVLMMDLNMFKAVNDSYGHSIGDQLLMQLAERIKAVIGAGDLCARIGGDEFAAVLPDTRSVEEGAEVAQKIAAQVDAPFFINELSLKIGMSIGISRFPRHGTDAEQLLCHADIAMYDGKRAGREITIYGSEDSRTDSSDMLIAQGLIAAIANGEISVVYQPQLDMGSGDLIGAEALVRWHHPQLGHMLPAKFIPVAEQFGQIEALTIYVLRTALLQAQAWRDQDLSLPVSVNLSAHLLDRPQMVDKIKAAIGEIGVAPEYLCLEVTETGIMRYPHLAERTLHELSDLGVQISIDDFGTGYSPLKYLRNFPIDEIKIDQLFVSSLESQSRDALIVESVLALGKAFGVRVLAEGVETDEVRQLLLKLGCRYGQGYYFAKPMPVEDFERWRLSPERSVQTAPGSG